MRQILCFSNEPWSTIPGRTQELVTRLKNVEVLFFAPADPGPERPSVRAEGKVRSDITVCTLPSPLLETREGDFFFSLQQKRLARFVAQRAADLHFREPLLWITCPAHVHLLDHLNFRGLIYDCDRSWNRLPPHWEQRLAEHADVVFAASRMLAEKLSFCSSNVVLIRNGVSHSLFGVPGEQMEPVLPLVPGPVLGWIGTIRPQVDLSPLLYAARSRPDWTFFLLGPVEGHPLLNSLERLRNLRIPGPRPLHRISAWLFRSDALLEFRRPDQPEDLLSSRIYEYFCSGRPIVAMYREEQSGQYPDVIYAAHSNREFLELCGRAMEEDPPLAPQRRQAYGQAASWSARARGISRILESVGLL